MHGHQVFYTCNDNSIMVALIPSLGFPSSSIRLVSSSISTSGGGGSSWSFMTSGSPRTT